MISGHILLTNAGMELACIEKEQRNEVVKNFCEMRDKAFGEWKDKFYADYGENDIVGLYSHCCERPSYWEGIDTKVIQLLQQTFSNFPIHVNVELFCTKPEPRTEGGFDYQGHPIINYVYDCSSLENWHNAWNRNHTDLIEWESEIFPFKSLIVKRMKRELSGISESFADYDLEERMLLSRFQSDELTDDEIVTAFHNLIVKHKNNEERAAYAEDIGEKICIENGYKRELDLERLEKEKDYGNKKVVKIFSIRRNNAYIFLSIDIKHGMLEWCGDDGSHKGERRFDGSPNGDPNTTIESDHGLKCVAEWKRLHNH